jgi:hypothetical protein
MPQRHRLGQGSLDRFLAKVEPTLLCWKWLGAVGSSGFGVFHAGPGRRLALAHRYAYEAFVGPIPAGLVLDHLCSNRRCVNPAHLEPVSYAENVRRGRARRPPRDAVARLVRAKGRSCRCAPAVSSGDRYTLFGIREIEGSEPEEKPDSDELGRRVVLL